jgi:hypothetical protein
MSELDDPVVVELPLGGEWSVERSPADRIPATAPTCSDSATPTTWSAPTTAPGSMYTPPGPCAGCWLGADAGLLRLGTTGPCRLGRRARAPVAPPGAGVLVGGEDHGGIRAGRAGSRPACRQPRDRGNRRDARAVRAPGAGERRRHQGQQVRVGEMLGWVGHSGNSTAPTPTFSADGLGGTAADKGEEQQRCRCGAAVAQRGAEQPGLDPVPAMPSRSRRHPSLPGGGQRLPCGRQRHGEQHRGGREPDRKVGGHWQAAISDGLAEHDHTAELQRPDTMRPLPSASTRDRRLSGAFMLASTIWSYPWSASAAAPFGGVTAVQPVAFTCVEGPAHGLGLRRPARQRRPG